MKVHVNPARCKGHKSCNALCPELYVLDEWGYALVASEDVPAGMEGGAREGADACPEKAITLVEG